MQLFLIMDAKKRGLYFKGFKDPKGYSSWTFNEENSYIFKNIEEVVSTMHKINSSVIVDYTTKKILSEKDIVILIEQSFNITVNNDTSKSELSSGEEFFEGQQLTLDF